MKDIEDESDIKNMGKDIERAQSLDNRPIGLRGFS